MPESLPPFVPPVKTGQSRIASKAYRLIIGRPFRSNEMQLEEIFDVFGPSCTLA